MDDQLLCSFEKDIVDILENGSTKNDEEDIAEKAKNLGYVAVYQSLGKLATCSATPINIPTHIVDDKSAKSARQFLGIIFRDIKRKENSARQIAVRLVEIDFFEFQRHKRTSFNVVMQAYCSAVLPEDVQSCVRRCLKTLVMVVNKDGATLNMIKNYLFLPFHKEYRSVCHEDLGDNEIVRTMASILNKKGYHMNYNAEHFFRRDPATDQSAGMFTATYLCLPMNVATKKPPAKVIFYFHIPQWGLLHALLRHDIQYIFARIFGLSDYIIKLRSRISNHVGNYPDYQAFELYWRSEASNSDRAILYRCQRSLAIWMSNTARILKSEEPQDDRKVAYTFDYNNRDLVVILRKGKWKSFVTAFYK